MDRPLGVLPLLGTGDSDASAEVEDPARSCVLCWSRECATPEAGVPVDRATLSQLAHDLEQRVHDVGALVERGVA